jgi:hypothetical protein
MTIIVTRLSKQVSFAFAGVMNVTGTAPLQSNAHVSKAVAHEQKLRCVMEGKLVGSNQLTHQLATSCHQLLLSPDLLLI